MCIAPGSQRLREAAGVALHVPGTSAFERRVADWPARRRGGHDGRASRRSPPPVTTFTKRPDVAGRRSRPEHWLGLAGIAQKSPTATQDAASVVGTHAIHGCDRQTRSPEYEDGLLNDIVGVGPNPSEPATLSVGRDQPHRLGGTSRPRPAPDVVQTRSPIAAGEPPFMGPRSRAGGGARVRDPVRLPVLAESINRVSPRTNRE